VNEQIVELGEPLRAENERLRGALKFYAERDDLNNYVAVAALKETTSSTGGNIPPETENTDFPVGTMGRTDGLTDDMGG